MATTTVTGVLDRTMRDEAFLDRFRADPEAALADHDLTDAERAALLSGDDERVVDALGDARLGWELTVVVIVLP